MKLRQAWNARVRFPVEEGIFLFATGSGAHPASYIMGAKFKYRMSSWHGI